MGMYSLSGIYKIQFQSLKMCNERKTGAFGGLRMFLHIALLNYVQINDLKISNL